MKLKNISQKVISIGAIVLMPDKDIQITAHKAKLPSIKALVKAGFLSIDDSEERIKAIKKEEAESARKSAEEADKKAVSEKKVAEKKAEKATAAQK